MSSDVNSTLPDGDALAAFANTAFGSGRRRRRQQTEGSQEKPAESTTKSPAAEETQPGKEQAKEPEAPAPEPPTAAAPAPAPEPSTAPEPPTAAAPALAPEPSTAPEAGRAGTQPESSPSTAEVAVRAVPVAMSRPSPLPPGLQGGVIEVQVPDLGPAGARSTQCTVMVSQEVRDRFAHYQLQEKIAGRREPSNALVVRRAFLHAKRNGLFGEILRDVYHRVNAIDEGDYDEDGLLGEVVGRRPVRGRLRNTGQQSFRPSEQELATYDAFSAAYGFPDRSSFVEGLLDRFLPPLPASGRRR